MHRGHYTEGRVISNRQQPHSCAKILSHMISTEDVERACTEVSEYTEDEMATEFERFFVRQPELCDFIVELTTESGQKIQELSLFLSYMVFKAVENAGTPDLTPVSHTTIESALQESESWIERINKVESGEIEAAILDRLSTDNEPHLLQYVISEINQPLDDGTELGDEQKGEIFFVLKTVITSLSRRPIEEKGTDQTKE